MTDVIHEGNPTHEHTFKGKLQQHSGYLFVFLICKCGEIRRTRGY